MFTLHRNSTTARRTRGLGGLMVAALAVTSCGTADDGGGGATGPGATVASVEVSPATGALAAVGATLQFTAVAKDASGAAIAGKTFSWAIDGVTVATLSTSGLATALANGTATITATTEGVQGSAALTVAITEPVASIDVGPAASELNVLGATRQLIASAKDAAGNVIPGVVFNWSSADISVATVDAATGLATAVGSGTATISATADGISGSASLTINLTGAGSLSLLVVANIVANDLGFGLFTTVFDVTVTDALLAPVSGATVTFTNPDIGVVTLQETAVAGVYAFAAAQFPNTDFQLDVVRGADNVSGVVARGPGVHSITAPVLNAVLPADQDLTVTWTVPSQAKFAVVETRDFASGDVLDNGSFTIPGLDNPANGGQRIRVLRTNEVIIGGGLLGSRLQIQIQVEVDPVVIQ